MKPMKVRLREELQKIQSMKGRIRWEYIWGYYKFHIIGTIIGIFIFGSLLNDLVINPPPRSILTVAWLADFEWDERLHALGDALDAAVVENPNREKVFIPTFYLTDGADPQNDVAQIQRFQALLAARELDIIIGRIEDNDEFEFTGLGMAPSWVMTDLRPVLAEAGLTVDEDVLRFYYDDETGLPFAFAMSLEGSVLFADAGIPTAGRYLGVTVNTENYAHVVAAIRALWIGHE
ncbi:MAG: hypothetical protein FWD03_09275 [Defluviitaleaceae bacterium]|nr:hypothetical protein [Defluviitaleaceae bacterium]